MGDENGSSWGWYIFIFIIFLILFIVLAVDVYYWGIVSTDTTTDTSDLTNTCGITSSTASFLYWAHIIVLVIFVLIFVIAIFYWAFFSGEDEVVEYVRPQDNVLITQTDTGMVNTRLDYAGKSANGENVYRAAGSTINTPADINVNVQRRDEQIRAQQALPQYVVSPPQQPVLVQQQPVLVQQRQPTMVQQPQYLVQPQQRLGTI